MLRARDESTVGMQPVNTLSCFLGRAEQVKNKNHGILVATNDSFYGRNVVDDSICTECVHYWNCRLYLKPFEIEEMLFKRFNDED